MKTGRYEYVDGVAEALTLFMGITDALADGRMDALEEVFDHLEASLMGIGEVIGWDADSAGVQLHVSAEEPERVISTMVADLRTLDAERPWRLVAADPETGTILYERFLP
jgi:hypothetical protein